jgi:hypothetical protein
LAPSVANALITFIVFNEASLCRHLQAFIGYHHGTRTHLALEKDALEPRGVQPPDAGRIISIPEVGGLHHSTNAERPDKDSSTLQEQSDTGCPPVCDSTTGRSSSSMTISNRLCDPLWPLTPGANYSRSLSTSRAVASR